MTIRSGMGLLLLLFGSTGLAAAQPVPQLTWIGEADIATGTDYDGTEIGGLSGIDYDPASGRYVAISDNRGAHGPVRFYTLRLDLGDGRRRFDIKDVHFTGTTVIRNRAGKPLARGIADPESIRIGPQGNRIYWTSEGAAAQGRPPSVNVMTDDGAPVGRFTLPPAYAPRAGHGVRDNLAFESLTYQPAGDLWITAVENALVQDGPVPTTRHASPARVLAFDAATGRPVHQYVYEVSPIPGPSPDDGKAANNGLSEMLTLGPHRYIALERAFIPGVGNRIRLFRTTTRGATDISGRDSIRGGQIQPMPKHLLLDLDRAGIQTDNIEGMTFGPRIDGDRTLVLIADNNFNPHERTQILVFRLHAGAASNSASAG
ncbi:esterase-like activity of phytase family protein [Salinisphaera sp. Q1T1-3]|uniref:esterase-like activity of phytase family protein n=1 Tax=Salinisphaera sp. Q1T1-3 TaxID=2321229 RepID=UPI001313F439|nr:esterase-like activity of phytase family protein [Salinisphaera sp. Q1T1-3]